MRKQGKKKLLKVCIIWILNDKESVLGERKEIGVIPYFERNNTYRFVIVTARKHPKKWIFPKGQPEADKDDRSVAVNEAFEEAGIIGTIQGKSIKVSYSAGGDVVTCKLYPFKISKICRDWPERGVRKRKFVKLEKTADKLQSIPYSEALDRFIKKRLS